MRLREVLVYPEILSSARVHRLKPFAQLFYRNLMHVCDGGGVFENDPKLLCSALYPRALDRVTPKAIATWLMECREVGLLRFYTDEKGRSLGEFANWLQKDVKRRRRFATREQPPGELPRLFDADPPNLLNGIEEKSPQPPAGAGGRIASLSFQTPEENHAQRRPRATRRLPKLADLREEKALIDREIVEIMRPGGCAHNTLPTDPAKKARLDQLIVESNQLGEAMKNTRAAYAKETAA